MSFQPFFIYVLGCRKNVLCPGTTKAQNSDSCKRLWSFKRGFAMDYGHFHLLFDNEAVWLGLIYLSLVIGQILFFESTYERSIRTSHHTGIFQALDFWSKTHRAQSGPLSTFRRFSRHSSILRPSFNCIPTWGTSFLSFVHRYSRSTAFENHFRQLDDEC